MISVRGRSCYSPFENETGLTPGANDIARYDQCQYQVLPPKPLDYRDLDDDCPNASRQDTEIMPSSWQPFSVSCISVSPQVSVKTPTPAMSHKPSQSFAVPAWH